MNKLKQLAIISIFTLAIVTLAGAYGISSIKADEVSDYPPFIQRLAEHFGLEQGEVQNFFAQEREVRHQEMSTRNTERLKKLVEQGQITEEQKSFIEAKREEIKAKHEELRDLAPAERHEAMQVLRDEMNSWAVENGIELPLIDCPMGGLMKGMHSMKGGFGMERGSRGFDYQTQSLAN